MGIILLGALLAMAPSSAVAQVISDSCAFIVSCKGAQVGEVTFSLKSASGDCAEDDMSVSMTRHGKTKKLKIPENWYYEIENVGDIVSECKTQKNKEYPIFPIAPGRAMMFLLDSGRPTYSSVSVAIIDLAHATVIESHKLESTMRDSIGIFRTKDGFKLPLIRDNLSQARCDCDASVVEGWMELKWKRGKLEKSWMRN